MSTESALAFLKMLEQNSEFREKILEVSNIATLALVDVDKNEQEKQRALIAKEHGFTFSKEELFEAVGVPAIELGHKEEMQLRALDKQLRSRGLEGINPLAYTAYSLGIN